ncbi:hypothetical protein S245_044294, partial [Arachis hypogaea]
MYPRFFKSIRLIQNKLDAWKLVVKQPLIKANPLRTFVMQLFEERGNIDIKGVDSTNACYGGTTTLFNCMNWVESSSWDGRYGLVICANGT